METLQIRNRGPWTENTCPGYFVAQPQIGEAQQAADARKNGCLPLYFPHATAPLLEAARVLCNAYSGYKAEQMRIKKT